MPTEFESNDALATAVKAKYPQYKDWDNTKLAQSVMTKYPDAYKIKTKSTPSVKSAGVGDYLGEVAGGVGRAAKNILYDFPKSIAQASVPQTTGEKVQMAISPGLLPLTKLAGGIMSGFESGYEARQEARKQGEGVAGQILATLEHYPLGIGDITKHIEQGGGKMFSPQSIGGAAEAISYAVAPDVLGKAGKMVPEASKVADTLRRHGGAIESKRLNLPPESGYELAKTKTVGKLSDLATKRDPVTKQYIPGKIRDVIDREIKPKVAQGLKQADASAPPTDISQEMKVLVDEARAKARPSQLPQVNKAITDITNKVDPVSGKAVARDLTKMTPSEMYQLTQTLNDIAFGEDHPVAVYKFSRGARDMVGKKLDAVAPGIAALRSTESSLIEADRIVSKKYADKSMGATRDRLHSIFQGGAPTILSYLALKELGVPYAAAAGSIMGLMELSRLPSMTTFRGAMWNRIADLIDNPGKVTTPKVPTTPPSVGGQGQAAPSPAAPTPQAPQGPQAAQTAPKALPAPAAQNVAPTAPNTPQVPVQQQLTAGSAPPPVKPAAPEPAPQAPTPAKPTGPTTTVVPEGQSGMSPKAKAMMDRLDVLYERQAKPKSGADRVAIAREIDQIKKALDPNISQSDKSKIQTRIMDRERQQRHRKKESSKTTGDVQKASEATASTTSPEQHSIILQQGFEALAKFPDGKELAQSISKMPKEMQVGALTEAIEFLKQNHGALTPDEGKSK